MTTDAKDKLDPRWRKWLAENKMLRGNDPFLLDVLAKNGISPELARNELREIAEHPYFQAGADLAQLERKLESILGVFRKLAELSPRSRAVERRPAPGRDEFLVRYYSTNTPVILTDLVPRWKASTQWTPEWLKERLRDVEVEVQVDRSSDPLYERNLDKHRRTIPFPRYADMVAQAGETNDFYMVANNKNLDRKGLEVLFEDIEFPPYMDPGQTKGRVFFWFGPAGTVTPYHHDPMNVMLAQVSGRKRVRLISPSQTPLMYNYVGVFSEVDPEAPDVARYPLYRQVKPIEFVLQPGEVLFIPVGWWHYVRALDVSMSVSMTNFAFPNTYEWNDPYVAR